MDSNNTVRQPQAPVLCAKGCGFYGNPMTLNMCSKCYRQHEAEHKQSENLQKQPKPEEKMEVDSEASKSENAVEQAAPAAESSAASSPAEQVDPAAAVPAPGTPSADSSSSASTSAEASAAAPAADATASPVAAPAEAAPELPKQTHTNRCWSCNKKIGLTGFKCRCNYVFCGEHRYSDKHSCSFDYKSMAKDLLAKANPVVQAAKIEKI